MINLLQSSGATSFEIDTISRLPEITDISSNDTINNLPESNTLATTLLPASNEIETVDRKRREDIPYVSKEEYENLPHMPEDGILDDKSNYTAFIEIIGK